jgi:hypothetical protein
VHALDATILKAVSAWANPRQESLRWSALADLCVELGLAASDEDLRSDYAVLKRESTPKRKRT